MTDTTLDRYIALSDPAVHDEAALTALLALFHPDATVQIGPEAVHGHPAVTAFYRAHFASLADSRHFWNTTVLDDATPRAEWVGAARTADGRLVTAAGGASPGRQGGPHHQPAQRVHPAPRVVVLVRPRCDEDS